MQMPKVVLAAESTSCAGDRMASIRGFNTNAADSNETVNLSCVLGYLSVVSLSEEGKRRAATAAAARLATTGSSPPSRIAAFAARPVAAARWGSVMPASTQATSTQADENHIVKHQVLLL